MLAVAKGSANPPRLIVLEHNAPARGEVALRARPICLVGKGVSFDSGGLSLKPSASMVKMKHDMSGGATVIGAMRAAALLKVPLHVVGIVGAVENMPSGTAYRPDDIVTSASGKTIEIQNTDAEGRLVLADCLHFAQTRVRPHRHHRPGDADRRLRRRSRQLVCGGARQPRPSACELLIRSGEASGGALLAAPALGRAPRAHAQPVADVKQTGGREARHHHRGRLPVALRGR